MAAYQLHRSGHQEVKNIPKQAEVFKEMAGKFGIKVKAHCWTLGQYDIVATVEAPDDLSATALGLECDGKLPHTETLRAFGAGESGPSGARRDVTQKKPTAFCRSLASARAEEIQAQFGLRCLRPGAGKQQQCAK